MSFSFFQRTFRELVQSHTKKLENITYLKLSWFPAIWKFKFKNEVSSLVTTTAYYVLLVFNCLNWTSWNLISYSTFNSFLLHTSLEDIYTVKQWKQFTLLAHIVSVNIVSRELRYMSRLSTANFVALLRLTSQQMALQSERKVILENNN